MYKHGSLLALFCFHRMCITVRDKNDLWIATRSMEWKPSRAIPFLLPEMPMRACPHKRLDKNNLRKRREKKGGTKMNETRVFADGYRGVFQKQEDFLECLKSIGKNSFWERRNSKNLRLVAITSGSKVEEELKEK